MAKRNKTVAPSRECALIAAKAADAKKASDIMVQEVRELIGVTDYFVIATAQNNRQVDAIVDEIEERLCADGGMKPLHREGTGDGTWALLDYGSIVVHVFQPDTREFYRLEDLWNDAPVIDLAAEAGLTDIPYSERIAKMIAAHADAGGEGAEAVATEADAAEADDAEADVPAGPEAALQ